MIVHENVEMYVEIDENLEVVGVIRIIAASLWLKRDDILELCSDHQPVVHHFSTLLSIFVILW